MLVTTVVVFVSAFVLNLAMTPLILKLAHKREWLDNPNQRSVHKDPVPRLGGFGIFAAFFLTFGIMYVWDLISGGVLPPAARLQSTILVVLGLVSTFVLGLLDDFVQFRAIYKFLLQLLGAVLAIGAGLVVTTISIPFTNIVVDLGYFGPLLTLVWIVGITNAVNLIDGMDGLAGGFSVLAFTYLGLAMALTNHWFAAMSCFTVVGALLAFLVFNFPPAKIFMGDAGSLSLGYLMAILSLWGGPGESLFHQLWLLPFTVVLIPVADTVAAMVRRTRQGVPVWSPDKEHTHHKLLKLGVSTKGVLAIAYSTFIVTASPVLVMAAFPDDIQTGNLLLWLSLGSIAVVVGLFWALHAKFRAKFPDPAPGKKAQRAE